MDLNRPTVEKIQRELSRSPDGITIYSEHHHAVAVIITPEQYHIMQAALSILQDTPYIQKAIIHNHRLQFEASSHNHLTFEQVFEEELV